MQKHKVTLCKMPSSALHRLVNVPQNKENQDQKERGDQLLKRNQRDIFLVSNTGAITSIFHRLTEVSKKDLDNNLCTDSTMSH